jgi:hypothetical protein
MVACTGPSGKKSNRASKKLGRPSGPRTLRLGNKPSRTRRRGSSRLPGPRSRACEGSRRAGRPSWPVRRRARRIREERVVGRLEIRVMKPIGRRSNLRLAALIGSWFYDFSSFVFFSRLVQHFCRLAVAPRFFTFRWADVCYARIVLHWVCCPQFGSYASKQLPYSS